MSPILRCLLLLVFLVQIVSAGTLRWETQSWSAKTSNIRLFLPAFKHAYREDDLEISCETNNPNAKVTLFYRGSFKASKQSVKRIRKSKVLKRRQIFVFSSLEITDAGMYYCEAEDKMGNKILLKKGRLIVSPLVKSKLPEVIPNDEMLGEKHASFMIRCQTEGLGLHSKPFLSWHRKRKDGTTTRVPGRRISIQKRRRLDMTVVDEVGLLFDSFTEADVGEYFCQRQVARGHETYQKVSVRMKDVGT